jgi:hypothetical protein
MDSLPEPLVRTEMVAKRRFAANKILHAVMKVYQPGGTNEKTSILAAIATIGESATAEGALEHLRAWRRKTLRAKELKLYLPDPSIQYKALLVAVEKIRSEDLQLKIRLMKFEMKLETSANFASVEKFSQFLEAELQTLSYSNGVTEKPEKTAGTTPTTKALHERKGGEKGEKTGEKGSRKQGSGSSWKEPCRFWGEERGCMWGKQCNGYHSRPSPEQCTVCGSRLHKTSDCGRPKEAKEKSKGEKGDGKGRQGKGDKNGENGGKTGWKGQSQWGQGSWKGNSKGGERGKDNGKGDEVKNAVKLALEKNKEEEKEKKDKEDEKTKATEKENEAKEKFRQEISDEVSKTVGAEVVKALKTIARAKMLRSTGLADGKETGRENKNGTNFRPYLRSSTERVCLDSGSDQVMRPLFESETEEGLIDERVELATGKTVVMRANARGSLICQAGVQAIVPFVALLENLKYRLLRENGETILKRGQKK